MSDFVSRSEVDNLVKAAIADATKPRDELAEGVRALATDAIRRSVDDESAAQTLAGWAEGIDTLRIRLTGSAKYVLAADLLPICREWIAHAKAMKS